MRPPRPVAPAGTSSSFLWDLLTLDRLLTAPVAHLVYWCGLGMIAFVGFLSVGVAVGLIIREGFQGVLLAGPTIVAGLLVMALLILLWRSFCEFYVIVMRIGQDLNALRRVAEKEGTLTGQGTRTGQDWPR